MLAVVLAALAMPLVSPDGRFAATTTAVRNGQQGTQQIVVRDRDTGSTRAVYSVHESYARVPGGTPGPVVLLRWSGDSRWILFAIDPVGSNSIAADGLLLQAVSVRGGRPHRLATTLAYRDYFAWCSGRLVFVAGGDRLATTNKRLVVAAPPGWRVQPLVRTPGRAWGSLACSPEGRSVVVQSQTESRDFNFFHTRWALWRVGLDGSARQLTSPPRGSADESPRFSRDGRTVVFVRSRRGHGRLLALRAVASPAPCARSGTDSGYGHRSWWSRSR